MPAKLHSCAISGLRGELIEVEVDILPSQTSSFCIVGLGDTAVQEAKERVRAAIKNAGCKFPWRRKIVNLAPADLKKQGPAFDLPIAIGLLMADKQIQAGNLEKSFFIGELSLEGLVRPITGILPITIFAKEKKFKRVYVPFANAPEASLIPDIEVIAVENLQQLINHLNGECEIPPFPPIDLKTMRPQMPLCYDMQHVKGQEHAKRALEIAAAGSHNILML